MEALRVDWTNIYILKILQLRRDLVALRFLLPLPKLALI